MPTHLLVIGRGGELIVTTRRGATVAGSIPVSIMRAGLAGGVPSQGHLPASSRPAVLTRVHQCGGSPIHHAPARLADRGARPPPRRALPHHSQPMLTCACARQAPSPHLRQITPSTRRNGQLTSRSTSVLQPHLAADGGAVRAAGSTPAGQER